MYVTVQQFEEEKQMCVKAICVSMGLSIIIFFVMFYSSFCATYSNIAIVLIVN